MPRPKTRSQWRRRFAGTLLIAALCGTPWVAAFADGCPDASQDIVTDRPSVTNSSVVVPTGSLQMENGVNWTVHPGQGALDGPNTRLRLGIAYCTEMLVDLPDFTGGIYGHGPVGFSDIAPAIKHQFGGLPQGTNLSATVGLALPTGAQAITMAKGPSANTDGFIVQPAEFRLPLGCQRDRLRSRAPPVPGETAAAQAGGRRPVPGV